MTVIIKALKEEGDIWRKRFLFNKNRAYFISNVAQWFRKSHIIELAYRGGLCSQKAMTFND